MVLIFKRNKYTYGVHRFQNNDYNNYYHNLIYTHNNNNIYDVKYNDTDDNYSLSPSSTIMKHRRISMRSISAMNYHAAVIIQKSFRGYHLRYMLWSYGQILYNSKGNIRK